MSADPSKRVGGHALIGTSWRGASGDVATVERVERRIAIGRWESGILWHEHVDQLPKLYTPAPALPASEEPTRG